ncbi:hypothetical protein D3C85_1208090 [compost metagenome]
MLLQGLHCRQRFVLGQALRVALVGGNAQADDELFVGAGAHGGDDLAQKAQALRQFAVVVVGTTIDPWVEELRGQVAVAGDDLHAVHTGRVQAPGRGGVTGDDLVDHGLVEGARHDPEALVGHRRRRVGHGEQAIARLHDFPPGVENLRQHHGALGMARLGQAPVAVDAGIVGGHQHMGGVARTVVHPGHLQDDQAGAAFGTGTVISDQLFVDQVIGGHGRVVAAGHDPVFQAFAADLQGFEQMSEGVAGRHLWSPRCPSFGLFICL